MCEECDPFVPSFGGWSGHFPLVPDTNNHAERTEVKAYAQEQELRVNKATHRIRFEDETESEVTVVIEPKEMKS